MVACIAAALACAIPPTHGQVPLSVGAFTVTDGNGAVEDHLLIVDLAEAAFSDIGPLQATSTSGLAYDAATARLYGVNRDAATLVVIDSLSGAADTVGPLGFGNVVALAHDANTSTLFAVDAIAGLLLTVNPETGAATAVGPLGSDAPNVRGLAYDAAGQTLFGANINPERLVAIDTTTGQASIVGEFGGGGQFNIQGLAHDDVTGALYGVSNDNFGADGRVVTIDKATGSVTVQSATVDDLGPLGFELVRALPDALLGQPYSQQVPIFGGQSPYAVTDVKGLPPGLQMLPTGLVIDAGGGASPCGVYHVSLRVTDALLATVDTSVTLRVTASQPLIVPALSLPNAIAGEPYQHQIVAEGGCPEYTFSDVTGLPPGLQIDSAGLVTDTGAGAQACGDFVVSMIVSDTDNPPSMFQPSLALRVEADEPLEVLNTVLPGGTLGVSYSAQVPIAGGCAPYFVTNAIGLPLGLTIDVNGNITDTGNGPLQCGPFVIDLTIQDMLGTVITPTLSLHIQPAEPLDVVDDALPDGAQGQPYAESIPIIGGCTPYVVDNVSGLPEGLQVDAAGLITDTGAGPIECGPFSVMFDVTDRDNTIISRTMSLTVTPAVPLGLRAYFYVTDGGGPLALNLLRLNLEDNAVEVVGPLTAQRLEALAYDRNTGILYGANDSGNRLVRIDTLTGEDVIIGQLGLDQVRGLAFDHDNNVLYGVETATDQLLTIDVTTGVATPVGPLGFAEVEGFAFDGASGTLYGADADTDSLITIDPATGAGTVVGPFTGDATSIRGLSFDAQTGMLYAVERDGEGGRLFVVDTATGIAQQIGDTYVNMGPRAIELIRDLPQATLGATYAATLPSAGGCPAYTATNVTGLPDGLQINADGTIVDTGAGPTQCGMFEISFDLSDVTGAVVPSSTRIRVVPVEAPAVVTETLPEGVVGQPYAAQIDVTGGCEPYAFSDATGLPAGLVLDDTGAIADIGAGPTECGDFTVGFTVTDSASPPTVFAATVALRVQSDVALVVLPGDLPEGTQGQPYAAQIPIQGGCPPYEVRSVTGLPDGLQVDAGGMITDTGAGPIECGPFAVGFDVVDVLGTLIAAKLPLHIIAADALHAPPGDLPGGVLGQAYAAQIPIEGGCPAYTVSNVTGLPAGLQVDAGGFITDTGAGPTECGPFTIGFDVTDVDGNFVSGSLSLELLPASPLAVAGGFYATDGAQALSDMLLLMDVPNNTLIPVGALASESIEGTAYDATAGIVYAADDAANQLVVLDIASGAMTAVGSFGFGQVRCLAFDAASGQLYGADDSTDQLIAIDTSTGAGVVIGAIGFTGVQSLALNQTTGLLYGVDVDTDALIRIRTQNGAGTMIGLLNANAGSIRGLSFDDATGVLYALERDGDDGRLFEIDIGTGQAEQIGDDYLNLGPRSLEIVAQLPPAVQGQGYAAQMPFKGGCAPYSVDNIVGLPDGLQVDATGAVTDAGNGPIECGFFDIHFDLEDRFGVVSGQFGLHVSPAVALAVPIAELPAGTVGEAYGEQVPVDGGCPPYAFDNVSGLPGGLQMDAAGLIVDTGNGPTECGEFDVAFDVHDGQSPPDVVRATLALRIAGADALVVVSGDLPDGMLGEPYGEVILAEGGCPPYTFDNAAGLPAGLELDASGILRDTGDGPTECGPFDISFDVTDALGTQISHALPLDILPAEALEVIPLIYVADGSNTLEDHMLEIVFGGETLTDRGLLPVAELLGLAYDPIHDVLYGADNNTDELVVVNPRTASVEFIGPLDVPRVQSLAYDADTETLYGFDGSTDSLFTIDTTTGAATAIGPVGFDDVDGLAFDEETGTLFGADNNSESLITISTVTGAGTLVGPFVGGNVNSIQSLVYDEQTGYLFGVEQDGVNGRLMRIDPLTAAAEVAGGSYTDLGPTAMHFVRELPRAVLGQTYDAQIPIAGGCAPYSVANLNGLPAGLAFDEAGNVFDTGGGPLEFGIFEITFEVIDRHDPIVRSILLHVESGATGDFNGDGAVDNEDYAVFAGCLDIPGGAPPGACRMAFDFDGDGDIDLADFAVLVLLFD